MDPISQSSVQDSSCSVCRQFKLVFTLARGNSRGGHVQFCICQTGIRVERTDVARVLLISAILPATTTPGLCGHQFWFRVGNWVFPTLDTETSAVVFHACSLENDPFLTKLGLSSLLISETLELWHFSIKSFEVQPSPPLVSPRCYRKQFNK